MYRSELPKNCPPEEAIETEMFLYRLFVPDNPVESFKSHAELFPQNQSYVTECLPNGLSFFDNLDYPTELLQKENNQGKIIVRILVKKDFGKLCRTGKKKKGHYTLWLYKNFDPSLIQYEIVTTN